MGSGTVILAPVVIQDGYGGNLLRVDNDQRVLTDSSVSSTVLPPDAATETTQATLLTEAEFEARIGEVSASPTSNTILGRLKDIYDSTVARLGTLGQKPMTGSTPVVIASDQTNIDTNTHDGYGVPIGSTGDRLNVDADVSSIPLPPNAATESTLSAFRTDFQNEDFATETTQATLLTELEFETRVGEVSSTPTANTVLGRLKDITDSLSARLGTLGQKTMANSTPVVIASDQTNIKIDTYDGYGNPIASTGDRLHVDADITSTVLPPDAATESTQATLLTELEFETRIGEVSASPTANTVLGRLKDLNDTLIAEDFATETTLAAVDTKLATIDAVLDSIKDTDGIKKITDPLPTGTNHIGAVSQQGTWTVQQGTPPWAVSGTDADGASPTENPILTAGQDGTNVQTFKTDTTGRQEVVGGAADGATPAGNPVLIAGQDGTNVQSLKTDIVGHVEIVGPAADGATPIGNPVLTAGFDGANVQTNLTDTAGRQRIVGAAADGAAAVGDPVQVAGVDGYGNIQSILTETDGTVRVSSDIEDEAEAVVGADFYKSGVSSTTYYIAIDLDKPTSTYKHVGTSGLIVYSVSQTLVKSVVGSSWRSIMGVILSIDGTQATVGWLEMTSMHVEDTATSLAVKERMGFPLPANLTVTAGDLSQISLGYKETTTSINTGITLDDLAGDSRTPAVGDIVARIEQISGGGTATLHSSLWYRGVV